MTSRNFFRFHRFPQMAGRSIRWSTWGGVNFQTFNGELNRVVIVNDFGYPERIVYFHQHY